MASAMGALAYRRPMSRPGIASQSLKCERSGSLLSSGLLTYRCLRNIPITAETRSLTGQPRPVTCALGRAHCMRSTRSVLWPPGCNSYAATRHFRGVGAV